MIRNKADYWEYIKKDREANSKPIKFSIIQRIKGFFSPDYINRFLYLLRKTEYYKNCNQNVLVKILFLFYLLKFKEISVKLGFSIPLNVFGPGLSIPHYGTIIVNENARIGKNCRLHAGVNIGASGGSNLAPVLGDNVYLGPGAILFGGIIIANNITIAANSTVNKSFNINNCTIGGTPSKIITENTNVWWEKNHLNLSI
jgi:serine O-acetyltransferase